MDKFLCANASSWSSLASSDAEEGGGLLALMKKSREDKAPAASSSSSSSAAPSWSQQHCSVINDAWQSSSSASYSLADVNFQTRHQKLNSNKNSKGWRVINGEKVYVTMRAEGVVKATGREAFLLSRADEGKAKNKKNINSCAGKEGSGDTETNRVKRGHSKITDHLMKKSPLDITGHDPLHASQTSCTQTEKKTKTMIKKRKVVVSNSLKQMEESTKNRSSYVPSSTHNYTAGCAESENNEWTARKEQQTKEIYSPRSEDFQGTTMSSISHHKASMSPPPAADTVPVSLSAAALLFKF